MRCRDCNKFVSFDTEQEPEEEDSSFDGSTVIATFQRVLACGNCGTELKQASLEISVEIPDVTEKCKGTESGGEHDWEIEMEASPTTGSITKDRNGKPIKWARAIKTTYGIEVTGNVKCGNCDETHDFNGDAEEQASAFEELT